MKKCIKCKVEKPLIEFSKDKTKKDGLQHRCKTCNKEYSNNYNKTNKAKQSLLNYFYKICGIYQIIDNNTNECLYIGKSTMFNHRKVQHQKLIKHPEKSIKHKKLYYAINNHNNVSINVIEECLREVLLEREKYYIDIKKPLYNKFK